MIAWRTVDRSLLPGDEERTIIAPAVERARQQGIDVVGPIPADTLFVRAERGEFYGIVAMYHDQGHIPIKLLTGLAAAQGYAGDDAAIEPEVINVQSLRLVPEGASRPALLPRPHIPLPSTQDDPGPAPLLLGDIPFIGRLFQHQASTLDKTDLVIEVTPRVMPEQ